MPEVGWLPALCLIAGAVALALALAAIILALLRRIRVLAELAYVDQVTGGCTQARFERMAAERLSGALANEYMLVTLNLEGFKLVNDAFGSERGDAVLRHVYRTVERWMDEGDLLCRTFADHFILLVETKPRAEIVRRLQGLSTELNRFNEGAARAYRLVLSAGAYPIDDPSLPLVQIRDRSNVARLSAADLESGSLFSCGFYSDADRLRLLREKRLENRTGDLVESGELAVFLQPKLDLRVGGVAGAEALVRWRDPERGLVMPDGFVPFYERNGYIVKIDLFVFESACALLRKWIGAGVEPLPISFNLSRAHLSDPLFLDAFERVRERYGVPAHLLDFELTETYAASDPGVVAAAFDAIRAAGYRVSVDDFGSGCSSLNMLKDMRADTLKLDREFLYAARAASRGKPAAGDAAPDSSRASVEDPGPEAASGSGPGSSQLARLAPGEACLPPSGPADLPCAVVVVESVVAMAKRLGMQVVCEGVESDSQLEALAAMGCDLAQGFAIAPALPLDEFERMAFGRVVE
ncbi:GGDEF domain-containing phosphodiesterase [Raoultibacter phocaeensis]|uniref:GGDEF domain-containing phosphodiesterase n=1 Tax=Raoultibacter phocaeensis TaxID=2479841 RepID=UPI001119CF7E|nr:GGDEF domain-containing phosphodiesterase [Raoultibacter phocaeensis]